MDRRRFLRQTGICTAALAIYPRLLADPYAPLPPPLLGRTIRVRGAVHTAGRGIAGVSVSDGLSTVRTAADGTYEMITTAGRSTVQISVPAGFRVPVNATGTARFYVRIEPNPAGEATANFQLEALATSDDHHVVLMLGDIQTQDRREMRRFLEESVPDIIETRKALGDVDVVGIAVGDMMFDNLKLFPDYEQGVKQIGVPFFQVVGNHDLDSDATVDEASSQTFEQHFGPRYYSFDRGAVHYVVLDDVFWYGTSYLGYLALDQLAWLQSDLAYVEAGRTVVVCTHIPAQGSLYSRRGEKTAAPTTSLMNREMLFRLLEPYRAHIVVGHMHESEHLTIGKLHEHCCGAICGAWWSGPICSDGTPNGYSIYEARGSDISWRAKSTGLPPEHQMRLYPPGADRSAPNEIVANVWDWDPTWRVVWYEDGQRQGAMSQRKGFDPLSVELHKGKDKPKHREWVEPNPTEHLFYARPATNTVKTTVEATDRFGRVYTQELTTAKR